MPHVRNVSNDTRDVPAYGLRVQPGDTMTVPDADVDMWQHQTGVWELVKERKPRAKTEPEIEAASDEAASPAVDEA